MRILQVVPSLIKGGAERLVLNICKTLSKLGHEVMVVTLHDDNKYKNLSSDCDVRFVKSNVYYSLLGKNLVQTNEFNNLVDKFKPDIIHSHLLDAELVSRNKTSNSISYITHWHGCPDLTNPVPFNKLLSRENIWKWNTKRILKTQYRNCSNHFLCISEFIKKYVQQNLGINENNITVLHNAIDLNLFQPKHLPKKDGFRLINIGSLQANKNHFFLLRLMKKLVDEGYDDIYLDVYGEGPELNPLLKEKKELGLGEKVVFHGIVDNIEQQLDRAHLLVHSAWHEPFGLILVEAMACGIPVISFNTGGPSELVVDDVNGYLTNKGDLVKFADRVVQLYMNREKLDMLGLNAQGHARSFGLEAYTQKVEKLYEKLLSE
ncbi:MAG: glycosyltransferase [Flavobacteriales bacterium]|jgi:glycosyltransferase involved in cell wall biosynthesis|nr:glycosyltransferase [Flavobacteriales bacterium]